MATGPAIHDVIDGRYRLDAELGRGGMSVVYRATQLALNRPVALKMLLPEGTWDRTQLALFDREAQWARSIRHPHIIDVLDYGRSSSGLPYMVLELLQGRALKSALGTRRSDEWVGRFATAALKALMAAHEQGVVHRDIKPSNLYLCDFAGERDFVKVIDFGIAAAVAAASQDPLLQEGQVVGTPLYIAPEQVRGEGVGPHSDLYALGLVLAEVLAGRPVFPAELSPYEILRLQMSRDPAPLPESVLQGPWGELIERATRKDPALRTPTAEAMLLEVRRVADGGYEAPGARLSARGAARSPGVRPPRVGEVLEGRYRLDEAIGDRLLAGVFRGTHLGVGLPVAIKVLDPYYMTDTVRRARFLSEIQVMAGLRSPHTLRLTDLGETELGLPFLVFPWLNGAPLTEAVARGPLDAEHVAEAGLQVLESLEEAHEIGVIHGNLKPGNVFSLPMRRASMFICVTDYSLTRRYGAVSDDDVSDPDGEVLGSPRYMAPEQLLCRPVGPFTDLFSLAMLLTEAFTGRPIYPDSVSPLAIANRVASASPVPLPPELREEPLGEVLSRALHKDPSRRFQTCGEMRRALLTAD